MKELSFGVFDHIERTSGSPNLEELYQERLRLLKAYDQAGIWELSPRPASPGSARDGPIGKSLSSRRPAHAPYSAWNGGLPAPVL
jgi:hypothetical protein